MERSNDAKSRGCRTRAKPDNSRSGESYWELVSDSTMPPPKLGAEENKTIRGGVDADRAKGTAYEMATSGVGNFFVI